MFYDIFGNVVSSSGSSDLGVVNYATFTNDEKESARQATLTYKGRKLYPYSYPQQRKDFIRNYGGKIGLFLGDSYTAMGAKNITQFGEKHDLVIDNRGFVSSTIAGSSDNVTVGYHAFWVRLDEALKEYENGKVIDDVTYTLNDIAFIHIMGGANDWNTVNSEVDRLGKGANETNKETLYGALNYIFSTCLSKCTNADIVVTLQPTNYATSIPISEKEVQNVGFDTLAQAQEMSDAQYSVYLMTRKERIVREMAERYGIPINDCCFNWYNPCNETYAKMYWQSDKLHLTDDGNKQLFNVDLERVVNNLVHSEY